MEELTTSQSLCLEWAKAVGSSTQGKISPADFEVVTAAFVNKLNSREIVARDFINYGALPLAHFVLDTDANGKQCIKKMLKVFENMSRAASPYMCGIISETYKQLMIDRLYHADNFKAAVDEIVKTVVNAFNGVQEDYLDNDAEDVEPQEELSRFHEAGIERTLQDLKHNDWALVGQFIAFFTIEHRKFESRRTKEPTR